MSISKNGTIEKVRELLKKEVISLRQLERATGYSRTAISQFFSGNYKGSVDQVAAAIERWYLGYEKRHSLAETSSFNAIQMVCQLAWEYRELAVIYGNAGIGKTECVLYYADTNPDHAVYVKMDVSLTMSELLNQILKALDEPVSVGTLRGKLEQIMKTLRMRNRLIIIDEADLLRIRQLEMLRAIYDDGNCGMVLIGLERIIKIMTRGESLRENLAQLYSRVGFKRHVLKPTTDDVRKIAQLRGIELSTPAIKKLQEWIGGSGELRMLTKILDRAEMLARAERKEFDESYLKQAYSLLLGN